jgi:very-short-patch-repair endonuclease
METRLRLLLADSGIPPSATQFEVVDTAGVLLGRLDLAWPEVRLGVEYDGDHHRDREQFRRDMDRLNRLRMAGWTVLRFTAEDVLRRPAETARMVLFALATAGRT